MTNTQLTVFSALLYAAGTLAEKVILYDAQSASEFCNWEVRKQVENGKLQTLTAYPGPCNQINAMQNTTWFVSSNPIKVELANMFSISLTVNLEYLRNHPTLVLLAAQTTSGKPLQYQYNILHQTSLNTRTTVVTQSVARTNTYVNIGLSLPDLDWRPPPEYLVIARASAYFYKCVSRRANMATFPDVTAPTGDADSRAEGRCMPNTVPETSRGVWMYCDKTGSVSKIYGCQCRAGFEKVSNSCSVCPDGMYKEKPGNHRCSKCGAGSVSTRDGTGCPCLTGSREATDKHAYSADCKSIGHQYIVIILGCVSGVALLAALGLLAYISKLKGRHAGEQQPLLNPARNGDRAREHAAPNEEPVLNNER